MACGWRRHRRSRESGWLLRKGNVSDATVAVLEKQLEYDLGVITWTRIDTARPKDEALAAGRAVLGV